jgi:ACS family hexuronate transporter-like MFS transporter
VPVMPGIGWILLLFSMAFFGQQSWSTLVMVLPTDLVPQQALGNLAGLVGLGGAMGGVVLGQTAGWMLDHGFSYTPVLIIAASLHVIAFGVICLSIPQLKPLTFGKSQS